MSIVILHRGEPAFWSSDDVSAVVVYRNLVGLNAIDNRHSYLAQMSTDHFGNSLDVTKLRLVAASAKANVVLNGEVVLKAGTPLDIVAVIRDGLKVRTPSGTEISLSSRQIAYTAKDPGAQF